MGFRRWRNKPLTTNWRVGKIGAGVPRPCSAKRAKESKNESKRTGRPARISNPPMTRKATVPSRGVPTCHREIRQGT